MKPIDFIHQKHPIVQAAESMHMDHEVQMAREECYHAASNAMELHRLLKHVSEEEGLQGWASEKITLANDYLRNVKEWLEYELGHQLEAKVDEENMNMFAESGSGAAKQQAATAIAMKKAGKKPKEVSESSESEKVKMPNGQRPKGIGWVLKQAGEKSGKDYSVWEQKIKRVNKQGVAEFASAGASSSGGMATTNMGGQQAGELFGGPIKRTRK
jgi:hypothetical protein